MFFVYFSVVSLTGQDATKKFQKKTYKNKTKRQQKFFFKELKIFRKQLCDKNIFLINFYIASEDLFICFVLSAAYFFSVVINWLN